MSRISFSTMLLGCVAATALTAQTTVTALPTSLTFTYQLGATALPALQKVSVKAKSGTPAYTTSNADATALWMTVSPDSGNLPANLSLRVNPTGLGVGQYTTSGITVTVVGVATPITIPVTLNVTSPPSTLKLSATTLTFTAPPSPVAAQTVQLSTDGAPMYFTATSGVPWLSVSPNVGVVLLGGQETLTITPDPTNLTPQTAAYAAKVTIVVSGVVPTPKAQTIAVSFTVNSSTPSISNIWPPALPINAGAQTITIRGKNFYTGSMASIQSVTTPLATTVLSGSALLAVVPAAQLTTAGSLNIVVSNPAPGGSSAAVALAVANIPTISAVTNVASYAAGSVSPGELITIFGTAIGPAAPASMTITNGIVDTTLGGVKLTISGIAAPLLYVSQTQVTAQVPYEATLGTGQPVSLTNGANTPATSSVKIVAHAPGLFTADGSGVSQAAAVNYGAITKAYTLNTAANPAYLGDTVLLYLTGEGDYNPTLTPRTGLIVPSSPNPLPQLNPLPTVTIGGSPATVTYAGRLGGSILGLLQINCVVPAAALPGKAVPVIVGIGGVNTQANVTLSIHQ